MNVTTAGTYDVEFRVASGGAGGTFHVSVGGVNKTGALTVPNTGGWQTWTTVRATGVTLAAGQQVWQLVMATNGASTAVGNFNWIRVVAAGSPPPPPPPPPPATPEIVIYGSDVTNANLHNWSKVSDATAAGNTRVASADRAGPTVNTPLAAPVDYFEASFNAPAGATGSPQAARAGDPKLNESVWVQLSGCHQCRWIPRLADRHRPGPDCQPGRLRQLRRVRLGLAGIAWCWENRPSRNLGRRPHTIRVQTREDGVSIDQIVLSPQRFVNSAPGLPTGDNTIVPK